MQIVHMRMEVKQRTHTITPVLQVVIKQLSYVHTLAPGRKPSGLLLHTTGDASKATSSQSCIISATTARATSKTEEREDLKMGQNSLHNM